MMAKKRPVATYDTKERRRLQEYFDAEKRLEMIDPSEELMEWIRKAAVSISAYKAQRGKRSNFPAPVDYIEAWWASQDVSEDYRLEHTYRQTQALKASRRLRDHIEDTAELSTEGLVEDIECPCCGDPTISAEVGVLPTWDSNEGIIPMDEHRVTSIGIECDCKCLTVEHHDYIEKEALDGFSQSA